MKRFFNKIKFKKNDEEIKIRYFLDFPYMETHCYKKNEKKIRALEPESLALKF